jgi:hypothetical protein
MTDCSADAVCLPVVSECERERRRGFLDGGRRLLRAADEGMV